MKIYAQNDQKSMDDSVFTIDLLSGVNRLTETKAKYSERRNRLVDKKINEVFNQLRSYQPGCGSSSLPC